MIALLTEAEQRERFDALPDSALVHVFPIFGPPHETGQRLACACHPRMELVPGGALILHHVLQ